MWMDISLALQQTHFNLHSILIVRFLATPFVSFE